MCGHGVYKHADGIVYSGSWLKGQMHGRGEETWPEGANYVGDFVEGVK